MSTFDAGTGVGRLVIDSTGVTSGVAAAGTALGSLNNISQQSYFQLRNLGMGFEAVGAAATAGLTMAANQAMNWQEGLARISAVTVDATQTAQQHAASMKLVADGIRNIAEVTPNSISNIMQTADALAQQGVRGEQLVAVTKEVTDLNNVMGTSAQQVVPFLTKMSVAYGLSTTDIQRLGNELLVANTKYPAQIQNIETLTQRIQGSAVAAGFSLPQMIAFSAGISMTGTEARLAASSMRALLDGVALTVSSGGPQLQKLGEVAQQSGQQFQQSFAKDPMNAIDNLITKIGDLRGNLEAQKSVLDSLGVTQKMQRDAIIGVADAQHTLAASGKDLNSVETDLQAAWEQNNQVQNATEQLYGTTSAQLDILKNKVDLTAQSFGANMLPAINEVARIFSDFASGLNNLPGPMKTALDITLALTAGLGTVGGLFILLGPRVMQAGQAFTALKESVAANAVAQGQSEAAARGMTIATEEEVAAGQQLLDQLAEEYGIEELVAEKGWEAALAIGGMTEEEQAAAEAAILLTTAEGEVSAAAYLMGAAVDFALGPIGLLIIGIGLAVTATTIFGSTQDVTKQKTDANRSTVEALTNAMQQEANGTANATRNWVLHQMAVDGSLTTMQRLGITAAQAMSVILGNASVESATEMFTKLQAAMASGDAGAKTLTNDITTFSADVNTAKQNVNSLTEANNALGGSMAALPSGEVVDLSTPSGKAAKQRSELQATQDLVGAQISAGSSADALASAQNKQGNAASGAAKSNAELKKSQDDIKAQTDDIALSEIKLADAIKAVATATSDAQEQLTKDQLSVESAQLSLRTSTFSLQDSQAALAKVMAGVPALDMAKALETLKSAQDSLAKSTLDVQDAQWQLNYLMEEGAGAHDIQLAQMALSDAQNKNAASATSVGDAQQKIIDLNKQYDPEAVAKAQDAVTQAQIGQTQASLSLHDAQQKVQQDQLALSQNEPYLAAVAAVDQAQLTLDGNYATIASDMQNMHTAMGGGTEITYAQTVDRLRQAVKGHADALQAAWLAQQNAIGIVPTAEQAAHHYADTLRTVAGQIHDPSVQGYFDDFASTIDAAATNSQHLQDQLSSLSDKVPNIGQNYKDLADKIRAIFDAGSTPAPKGSFWDVVQNTTVVNAIIRLFQAIPSNPPNLFGPDSHQVTGVGPAPGFTPPPAQYGALLSGPESGFLAMLHGMELVLPMDDPSRSMALLASSGLLRQMSASPASMGPGGLYGMTGSGGSYASAGAGASITHNGGDTFNLTALTNADPSAIMDEYFWKKRTATK